MIVSYSYKKLCQNDYLHEIMLVDLSYILDDIAPAENGTQALHLVI